MMSELNLSANQCRYDYGDLFGLNRFIVVTIMMTTVCVVGFFGNLLIVLILSQRRMRSPSNWYLVVLALFDTSVMAVSVLLYVVESLYDRTRNYQLYHAWSNYVEVLYGCSHFCQVVTVYLTLAATMERFISLWFESVARRFCMGSMPFLWISVVFAFTTLCTGSRFFELNIIINPNCTGRFGEFGLQPAKLLFDPLYNAVYTLYLGNILFVFLPFILLSVLNGLIYLRMRHQFRIEQFKLRQMNGNLRNMEKKNRPGKKNREATTVLVVVVFVFLICNFPGFALNVIEQIAGTFLQEYREFYATTRDVINLLAVINSAANFAIYLVLGSEFRREIWILLADFFRFLHCRWMLARISQSRSFNSSYDVEKMDTELSDPWLMRSDCSEDMLNMKNCNSCDPRIDSRPHSEVIWERRCVYWKELDHNSPVSHI